MFLSAYSSAKITKFERVFQSYDVKCTDIFFSSRCMTSIVQYALLFNQVEIEKMYNIFVLTLLFSTSFGCFLRQIVSILAKQNKLLTATWQTHNMETASVHENSCITAVLFVRL